MESAVEEAAARFAKQLLARPVETFPDGTRGRTIREREVASLVADLAILFARKGSPSALMRTIRIGLIQRLPGKRVGEAEDPVRVVERAFVETIAASFPGVGSGR